MMSADDICTCMYGRRKKKLPELDLLDTLGLDFFDVGGSVGGNL